MMCSALDDREVTAMLDMVTDADVAVVTPAEWAEFCYHFGLPVSERPTPDRPTEVLLSSPLYVPEGWTE